MLDLALWRTKINMAVSVLEELTLATLVKNLLAKVGSQEAPGVKGKLGLGAQSEAGQRLTELCQENTLVTANTLFQQCKR